MNKRAIFFLSLPISTCLMFEIACASPDNEYLKEPWSRLEIRRQDVFFNPTYKPGQRLYISENARNREESLAPIIIEDPGILQNIQQCFPFEKIEPSSKPTVLLNFECAVTTKSGKMFSLYYSDPKTSLSQNECGKISINLAGGYHYRGLAADRFFENIWIVCRKNGLFNGSFSEFIVTSDNSKDYFSTTIRDRDIRLEQELDGHRQSILLSEVVYSPLEFDFGDVTEIERPVLTAMLRNDGDQTVHVTDVIRTCVCADLELSTTNLPPGGSAEVRCTLDPNVFSGPFLKTFFIKTDDPASPSITVPIRGSVRELWKVEPDKWYQLRAGETNAVLRVKAAPDAPALVRTEILGPAGASFELRPAGERVFDAVFTPGDQPRGQHHWTVNLYPEGAETPALGLHLGAQIGEHWKCVPARLRAPVNGRDFVADLLVKPADGKDLPADVDPAAITLSPVWDHVSIEPLGPPTWRGIPLRLTVGAEMVSSWEFPKTFYITVPNHGAASVYFEKIVPPTDATDQPGEMK